MRTRKSIYDAEIRDIWLEHKYGAFRIHKHLTDKYGDKAISLSTVQKRIDELEGLRHRTTGIVGRPRCEIPITDLIYDYYVNGLRGDKLARLYGVNRMTISRRIREFKALISAT